MSSPDPSKSFFYIADVDKLREKLARAEKGRTAMGRAWAALRHRARAKPDDHPWFTPFVAMVTRDPADIASAKRQVFKYLATFDGQEFGMGLHFHFWCFAFPHARWGLYFQWLDALGAWTEDERHKVLEELAVWQFAHFFSGMRMKPEPECVDNQTLALCYSNALFGRLFRDNTEVGALARRMARDGFRRLPGMLGGFPPSGYSGEGSTYMAGVVGPAIPFVVELLEAEHSGDWFNRTLPPNGGSAATVLKMLALETMPNGLMVPWDHYGYMQPVLSPLAYGAHRTGEAHYFELLESANWGYERGIAWGYDDLAWALVWWPEGKPKPAGKVFPSWVEKEVGGALISDKGDLYLMQMWDESTPKTPIRAHVNPNAVVLSAYGSPLTVDGVATKECHEFDYDDTWIDRSNMTFTALRMNYGGGCAGSHAVLLVDGWESMRADEVVLQARMLEFNAAANALAADVTPMYREKWPDTLCVRRRSRLCEDRFWLIEDLAAFREEHGVTSRWWFRPELMATERGVTIETVEGVRLELIPLLGPDVKEIKSIHGYPDRLDLESRRVDFQQKGTICRWLWLAFPSATRVEHEDITEGWRAAGDAQGRWTLDQAVAALEQKGQGLDVSIEMPPFIIANAPVIAVWWYRRKLAVPSGSGRAWLRLPRGMFEPRVWIDGREVDLKSRWKLAELMALDVELPAGAGSQLEVVLRVEVGVKQYAPRTVGSFAGRAAVVVPAATASAVSASWQDGTVRVTRGDESWSVRHDLLTVEEEK